MNPCTDERLYKRYSVLNINCDSNLCLTDMPKMATQPSGWDVTVGILNLKGEFFVFYVLK